MKQGVDAFGQLVDLESEVRNAPDAQALNLILVNGPRPLLNYRQAFLFMGKKYQCTAVSDLPHPDKNSSMIQWMEALVRGLGPEDREQLHAIDWKKLSKEDQGQWKEYAPPILIWLPLTGKIQGHMGGMLLAFDTLPPKKQMVLMSHLGESFGHALQVFHPRDFWARFKDYRPKKIPWILMALMVLCIRVHLSPMAPAEIIPRDPIQVTSPLDGVVKQIQVNPNEMVEKGRLLATLEDRPWRHEYTMALKALAVALAEYQRAQRSAFKDTESQAHLAELKAQLDRRKEAVAQAKDRLERTRILAAAPGTAIVPRPEYWKGKPVGTGETLLEIADPQQVEVQIFLPVKDAILLDTHSRIRIFLDADPLSPLEAKFHHSQYKAELVPQGYYAYRLTARLNPESLPPRMGLRGTAKLYGPKVSLFYFLFRRPLTWLRQNTGI